jgi:predicted transposase YbfD/YdcC
MKYTPLPYEVNLEEGVVIELDSLFAALCTLHDKRDACGLRYALVTVLVFILLAKLGGQDHLRGIAQWVRLRKERPAEALGLVKAQAPHATTYSRVLRNAVDVEEYERVAQAFFRRQPEAGQSVLVCIDGKTLRGTIPAGQSQGMHLLAAYLPAEERVMMQVEVQGHENEIPAGGRMVQCIDLRNKIVTGDAQLAQRELSVQVVQAGGEYVWVVKDNQPQLRADIAALFGPEACAPGFSPTPKDFDTAHSAEKGHGRLERRTLTSSCMLKGYIDWPYAEQVLRIERRFVRVSDGLVEEETNYEVTSLTHAEADAKQLLGLVRGHWGIENGLHYRRDETLREDRCRITGQGAHVMAIINLVPRLPLRQAVTNVPDAQALRCQPRGGGEAVSPGSRMTLQQP